MFLARRCRLLSEPRPLLQHLRLRWDTLLCQHGYQRSNLIGIRHREFLEGDPLLSVPLLQHVGPPSILLHAPTQVPERQFFGLGWGITKAAESLLLIGIGRHDTIRDDRYDPPVPQRVGVGPDPQGPMVGAEGEDTGGLQFKGESQRGENLRVGLLVLNQLLEAVPLSPHLRSVAMHAQYSGARESLEWCGGALSGPPQNS